MQILIIFLNPRLTKQLDWLMIDMIIEQTSRHHDLACPGWKKLLGLDISGDKRSALKPRISRACSKANWKAQLPVFSSWVGRSLGYSGVVSKARQEGKCRDVTLNKNSGHETPRLHTSFCETTRLFRKKQYHPADIPRSGNPGNPCG